MAGLRGSWSVQPEEMASLGTGGDPAGEASVVPTRAGTFTVKVDVDGTTLAEEFTARAASD